jgi:hypothetical protein
MISPALPLCTPHCVRSIFVEEQRLLKTKKRVAQADAERAEKQLVQ